MPALLLKALNLHQFLAPAERFLLLRHPRIAHMSEQSEINHILILLVEWEDLVVLLLREADLGLEPLLREVILGLCPLSGVDLGLHRGGEDLEVPRGVAGLGLLNDQVGPGAEMPRGEADLGQQGEAGHILDLQLPGADLVLEHQFGGVDLVLEPLQGAGRDLEHLPDAGLGLEHLLGGPGLGPEHLLGADLGPGHQ